MKHIFLFLFCISFSSLSVAQNLGWSTTQGPYAIAVNAFASSGANLYAGTNNGLYKSSNDGDNWSPVYAITGIVRDIEIKDTNIYVGGSSGVTISTDAGTTWAVRDSGLPQFSIVYVLQAVHDTLYACLGGEGFFRSVDGGKYWAVPGFGLENKSIFSMIWTGNSILLAAGAGILRSSDNGTTWDEQSGILANLAIHCFIKKGNQVFAGTETGVFLSNDDGLTWSALSNGMHADDIISTLALSSDAKTIFAGASNLSGDVGIYRSGNDGSSWSLVNYGLTDIGIKALHSLGTKTFTGTSLGVARSDNNGDLWQTASEGFPKQAVTALGSIYHIVFAGTTGSFAFGTVDAGNNWMQHKRGLTRPNVKAILGVGNSFFAGTDALLIQGNGGLHLTTDYGTTWKQVTNGIPVMTITSIEKNNTKLYAAGDSGIYSSSDNGNTWEQASTLIAKTLFVTDPKVYVITKINIWEYATNSGWSPVIIQDVQNRDFHDITEINSTLFLATDSGIYKTSDNGLNWQLLTADSLNVQKLFGNDLLLVAGTSAGIYCSSDGGTTWQFQESAGKVFVNGFTSTGGNLYAATNAGVIKAALGSFAVKPSARKNGLSLQARNPSRENTEIKFKIHQHGITSLIAYDLLGREISTLIHQMKDAGEYELNWDTSSLTTGTYMIRLISGNEQAAITVNVIH